MYVNETAKTEKGEMEATRTFVNARAAIRGNAHGRNDRCKLI